MTTENILRDYLLNEAKVRQRENLVWAKKIEEKEDKEGKEEKLQKKMEKSIEKQLKKGQVLVMHTTRVVDLVESFLGALLELDGSLEVDKELLLTAAWLHDVAKLDGGDDHHLQGFVLPILEEYAVPQPEKVANIIALHKGAFTPREYPLEASILRICDKLDKFNKDPEKKVKALESCEKSRGVIALILEPQVYVMFADVYKKYLAQLQLVE